MKHEIKSNFTNSTSSDNSSTEAKMDKEDQAIVKNFLNLDHKKNWWVEAMARHQKWINEGGFHQLRNAILPQSKRSSTLPIVQTVDAKQSLEKQYDDAIKNATSSSILE